MAASKQANTRNVVTLVWGSLRLAAIDYICSMAAILARLTGLLLFIIKGLQALVHVIAHGECNKVLL